MLKWINKKRQRKGFTLVELVVVIAILGILATIAVPKLSRSRVTSQVAAHNANVRILKSAAGMYLADNPDQGDENITTKIAAYLDGDKLPVPYKYKTDAPSAFKVEIDKGNIIVTPGELEVDGGVAKEIPPTSED